MIPNHTVLLASPHKQWCVCSDQNLQ